MVVKQTEALKLALEALEECRRDPRLKYEHPYYDKTITAIREALTEQPRLLSAAPCDQCGYNGPGYYQPDTHQCAAKHHKALAHAPKEREQPAQVDPCIDGSCSCCWSHLDEQPVISAGPITPAMMQGPTPEQKAQMVEAMSKLAEQPAQQQEPVAYASDVEFDDETEIIPAEQKGKLGTAGLRIPLYIEPPASKPWVGLTDEDIETAMPGGIYDCLADPWDCGVGDGDEMRSIKKDVVRVSRAIEAKLREKNA